MSMHRRIARCLIGCAAVLAVAVQGQSTTETLTSQSVPLKHVEVSRIWDGGKHNAFTDLIRWRDRFYCVFREAGAHVPHNDAENGKIRLLTSADGKAWKPAALLTLDGIDLRDPKLSLTPDGRLMVLMGGSDYENGKLLKRAPYVCFWEPTKEGPGALKPVEIDPRIASSNDWLWRVTWHEKAAYGVVYQNHSGKEWGLHLVKSTDGVRYELVKTLEVDGNPNESTVRFLSDGTMLVIVRREVGDKMGVLGVAKAPYQDWTWKKMSVRLGGPDVCVLPDGGLLLGTRIYEPKPKMVLGKLTLDGDFTPLAELPSGGDTSYPGMVLHEGTLWVSYYSSHEGKTSIYLAKVPGIAD